MYLCGIRAGPASSPAGLAVLGGKNCAGGGLTNGALGHIIKEGTAVFLSPIFWKSSEVRSMDAGSSGGTRPKGAPKSRKGAALSVLPRPCRL